MWKHIFTEKPFLPASTVILQVQQKLYWRTASVLRPHIHRQSFWTYFLQTQMVVVLLLGFLPEFAGLIDVRSVFLWFFFRDFPILKFLWTLIWMFFCSVYLCIQYYSISVNLFLHGIQGQHDLVYLTLTFWTKVTSVSVVLTNTSESCADSKKVVLVTDSFMLLLLVHMPTQHFRSLLTV